LYELPERCYVNKHSTILKIGSPTSNKVFTKPTGITKVPPPILWCLCNRIGEITITTQETASIDKVLRAGYKALGKYMHHMQVTMVWDLK